MTEQFFREQLTRLIVELGGKPPSAGQVEAVWETVVRAHHLSGPEWVHVVNLALSGGRWPAPEAWDRYAEKAKAVVRSVASVTERLCDCGRGSFARDRGEWIYIGHGSFKFTGGDPGGAVHRMENPNQWAAAMKYRCTACGMEGWLMLDEGKSANTGRKFKPGDFILRTRGTPEPMPEESRIYHNEAYQLARRKLLTRIAREKMHKGAIADALFDMADDFPEQADHLVKESAMFREEYESGRSDPPTPPAPASPDGEAPDPWSGLESPDGTPGESERPASPGPA